MEQTPQAAEPGRITARRVTRSMPGGEPHVCAEITCGNGECQRVGAYNPGALLRS